MAEIVLYSMGNEKVRQVSSVRVRRLAEHAIIYKAAASENEICYDQRPDELLQVIWERPIPFKGVIYLLNQNGRDVSHLVDVMAMAILPVHEGSSYSPEFYQTLQCP